MGRMRLMWTRLLMAAPLLLVGCLAAESHPEGNASATNTPSLASDETIPTATVPTNESTQSLPPSATTSANRTVTLTRHIGKLPCILRLAETPVFGSCDENDPAPFNDQDRKPFRVPVDLTVANLATLGLEPKPYTYFVANLSWTPNAGIGDVFLVCWTFQGLPAQKLCDFPKPEEFAARNWTHRMFLFEDIAMWREPRVYEMWIEPLAWVRPPGSSPSGEANVIRDQSFTMDITLTPPSPSPSNG